MKLLDLEEGKKLVNLARKSIEYYLKEERKLETPEDISQKMRENRGVFVTLNKNGELRGCIGRPLSENPLVEGLIDSAISAATQDPRFPKLTLDELEDITIEVSILTPPERVEVENPKNYPDRINVGEDGLIVSCGGRRGLLLPQVPSEYGWDSEEFLSQTCVKAGVSPDSWLREDIEIKKFSAQIFKEKVPSGEVIEERISD